MDSERICNGGNQNHYHWISLSMPSSYVCSAKQSCLPILKQSLRNPIPLSGTIPEHSFISEARLYCCCPALNLISFCEASPFLPRYDTPLTRCNSRAVNAIPSLRTPLRAQRSRAPCASKGRPCLPIATIGSALSYKKPVTYVYT